LLRTNSPAGITAKRDHLAEPLRCNIEASKAQIMLAGGTRMGLRQLIVLAIFFSAVPEALAAERQPGVFQRASCTVVWYYVAKYSASAAEA
jgi:hypothetical protein